VVERRDQERLGEKKYNERRAPRSPESAQGDKHSAKNGYIKSSHNIARGRQIKSTNRRNLNLQLQHYNYDHNYYNTITL